MSDDWSVDAWFKNPFLGGPPHRAVVESPATEEFVGRIRVHEHRYGIRRLPYWFRYFHPHLHAEYGMRMDELRRTIATLGDEGRAYRDFRSPPRPAR